jgi:hypothetical protein
MMMRYLRDAHHENVTEIWFVSGVRRFATCGFVAETVLMKHALSFSAQ